MKLSQERCEEDDVPERSTAHYQRTHGLLHLLCFESFALEHREQTVIADQVERTDDDHVVLVFREQLLDLRHPALVALREQKVVERGELAVLEREQL